jgi:O-antigen ligase
MNKLSVFIILLLLSVFQKDLISQFSKIGLLILFLFNIFKLEKFPHKYNVVLTIWFVMIIGVFFSQDHLTSILRFSYSLFVIVGIIPLATLFGRNPDKYLNQFFLITSIWLLFNAGMIYSPLGYDNLGLFKGVTYNANTLGGVIVLIYFPLLMLKIQNKKTIVNLVLLFTTVLLIYLSHSRSAALCFFIGFVIIIGIKLKEKSKTILFSLMVIISFLCYNYNFISKEFIKYFIKYDFLDQSSILATRSDSWGIRFETISRKPFFGWGSGVNPIFIDRNLIKLYDVNLTPGNTEKGNSYLAIIEEQGIFTGLVIIILVLAIIKNIYKNSDLQKPKELLVVMVLIPGIVHALFESWLFYLGGYSSLWFWFIILASLSKTKTKYI